MWAFYQAPKENSWFAIKARCGFLQSDFSPVKSEKWGSFSLRTLGEQFTLRRQ